MIGKAPNSLHPAHLRNLERYRALAVVAGYAAQDGLRDCEEFIFDRFVGRDDDLIDLGVGAGRTTRYLAGRSRSYLGVDYSPEMVEACRRRFPEHEFRCLDAADLDDLPPRSADVIVFSFNGLSYLVPDEKRLACLRECRRVLRDRGRFIFSLPNPRSIFVRPALSGSTVTALSAAAVKALRASAVRIASRLSTRTFWSGRGYSELSAHGGLTTYLATPVRVDRELSAAGFAMAAVFPERYPRRQSALAARWYYYVYVKLPQRSYACAPPSRRNARRRISASAVEWRVT